MEELALKQIDYERVGDEHEVQIGQPQELHGLHAPGDIHQEELLKMYDEGNDTYQLLTGADGRTYETITFNADKRDQAHIIKPSTSFSSALKNPGNVIEAALSAAANPGAAYTYVGSFGNHPTGHMSRHDRWHNMRTGRFTSGDGSPHAPYEALNSVQDMASTLVEHLGQPTHVTADAEGGRLALGLMTALPQDSLRGAFLNGIDGISKGAYVMPKLAEDLKSRVARRQIDGADAKPGELVALQIKEVKRRMPNIYSGLGRIAHIAPLPVLLFPRDDRDKLQSTIGCMGNRNMLDLSNRAVFQDMSAALRQQEATITLQFNTESAIHDQDDVPRFGKLVMDHIPTELQSDKRRVRLLIGEGTLDYQTDAPHDRTRIERYAFPDITHKMTEYAGALALKSLPQQEQSSDYRNGSSQTA